MLRLQHEVDWAMMLDADETFHSTEGSGVQDLVKIPGCYFAAQICLNWAIYGSSGHKLAPLGLEVPYAYTRRAPLHHPVNRHCKVLVRPERVLDVLTPHACSVDGTTVNCEGVPIGWAPGEAPGITSDLPPVGRFRVNHYVTRSREHWERRLARGNFGGQRDEIMWRQLDRNDEEDLSAQIFYGKALRDEMAKLPMPPYASEALIHEWN